MRQFILFFIVFCLTFPTTLFGATPNPIVVTPEYLHTKYDLVTLLRSLNMTATPEQKIRVLIVPGHDDDVHGTAFGDLEEVDFNRVLAEELYNEFKKDPAFDPILTQTKAGYTQIFKTYLESESSNINEFIKSARKSMDKLMRQGKVEPIDGSVQHNVAPSLVIGRLYGINKWSQENNVDLIIHVHFNDYPGRPFGKEGKYKGFTIYIPDNQLQNGAASQAIAPSILDRLAKYMPISSLNGENSGITKDIELIAIGSNNTLVAPSMLIEYGYMYEPQLNDLSLREKFLKEYAFYTYEGIKNFFERRRDNPVGHDTTFIPHTWSVDLKKGMKNNADVAALQAALRSMNLYPTPDKTLSDCPVTGQFGPCTEAAVKLFQKKYGIPQLGNVGPMTRGKLNSLFGK